MQAGCAAILTKQIPKVGMHIYVFIYMCIYKRSCSAVDRMRLDGTKCQAHHMVPYRMKVVICQDAGIVIVAVVGKVALRGVRVEVRNARNPRNRREVGTYSGKPRRVSLLPRKLMGLEPGTADRSRCCTRSRPHFHGDSRLWTGNCT